MEFFLDVLFFQKQQSYPLCPIVDVGSGFGFPGIIFSILSPQTKIILLEPSEKRSEFLKHCISSLNLKPRIEVRKKSFESMNEKIFLFKAFSSLNKTLTLLQKYLNPEASSYHFKSLNYKNEWDHLTEKQKSFWKMNVFATYFFETQKRFILQINKTSP